MEISAEQEVVLIVEDVCANIHEMTNINSVHLQDGIGSHLAEAEGAEGHTA
jgi:hypothetical protein